ncbi:unnamed protein product [Pleuronectes platessa]|uniref:Uncharacterized protein n=1 Tax=Pleuronectes platessa TaxID=8262 RepID=A0A9N7UG38_PLEPL|nr:unnamed protein product [Pleuronectes platessa]
MSLLNTWCSFSPGAALLCQCIIVRVSPVSAAKLPGPDMRHHSERTRCRCCGLRDMSVWWWLIDSALVGAICREEEGAGTLISVGEAGGRNKEPLEEQWVPGPRELQSDEVWQCPLGAEAEEV